MSSQIEGIRLNDIDFDNLMREFAEITKKLDVKRVRKVLQYAARPYISAVQAAAPRSKAVHYMYNTPKWSNKLRAAPGDAVQFRSSTYHPGNLAKSFKELRLRKLRNARRVIVGPVVARKAQGRTFGRGSSARSVNGFYAPWVEFGTPIQRKNPFSQKAWDATRGLVMQKIRAGIKQLLK